MKNAGEELFCVFSLCVFALIGIIGASFSPPVSFPIALTVIVGVFLISFRLGSLMRDDAGDQRARIYHSHAKFWEQTASAVVQNADQYRTERDKWHMRLVMGLPVAKRRTREHTLKILRLIMHCDDEKALLPDWFFEVSPCR